MAKYLFEGKDKKTGKIVKGSLIYAKTPDWSNIKAKERPIIVEMCANGGLLWALKRWFVEEDSIKPVFDESK